MWSDVHPMKKPEQLNVHALMAQSLHHQEEDVVVVVVEDAAVVDEVETEEEMVTEEKMEMTMQKREAIEDVEDEVAVEVVEEEDEETNTINEKRKLSSEDQICHLRSIILPQKSKFQNLKQTDNLENFSEKKT